MTNRDIDQWVAYGIETGSRFGIESEFDVARFIDLMLLFGARFYEDTRLQWCASVMQDGTLDGRMRVDLLMARAIDFCRTMASSIEHGSRGE